MWTCTTLISQNVCLSLQNVYPSISSPRSVYPSLPLPCQTTADRGKRDYSTIYPGPLSPPTWGRAEMEKKSRMLLKVKGHLKQLAEREREKEGQQGLVAKERETLREQVKMASSY